MTRRFRTDKYQRRHRIHSRRFSRSHIDTLFSKIQLTIDNTCNQLLSNRSGFLKLHPLERKSRTQNKNSIIFHEVGIPHELHFDNVKDLVLENFKQKVNKYEIRTSLIEPYY